MNAKNGNSCAGSVLAVKSLRRLKRSIQKQHRKGIDVVEGAIRKIEHGYSKEALLSLERLRFIGLTAEELMLVDDTIDMLKVRSDSKLKTVTLGYVTSLTYKLAVDQSISFAIAEAVKYTLPFLISFQYQSVNKIPTQSFIEHELGLTQAEFVALCNRAPKSYFKDVQTKPSGGHRVIYKPHGCIKKHQRKLNQVLSKFPVASGICGGPGTTIMSAMKPHCHNPLLLTLDLKNFFPSIGQKRVEKLFHDVLDDQAMAPAFTRLCTTDRILPQGAPTSSTIARIIVEPAFVALQAALRKMHPNCEATIWVDDIVVSGPLGIRRAKNVLAKVFERFGFTVNQDKTKVMFGDAERSSLGLTLRDVIYPSAEVIKKFEACKRETPENFRSIAGYINFFKDVAKANDQYALT